VGTRIKADPVDLRDADQDHAHPNGVHSSAAFNRAWLVIGSGWQGVSAQIGDASPPGDFELGASVDVPASSTFVASALSRRDESLLPAGPGAA
jgi:hypothetical protein